MKILEEAEKSQYKLGMANCIALRALMHYEFSRPSQHETKSLN